MKYILSILALAFVANANAQSDLQHTPKGYLYQIYTHNPGEKLKMNDVVTFNVVQKTDKDSILFSSYVAGHPVKDQIHPPQPTVDLMEVLPLMAVKDSALIKVPADSIFKGHEESRPAFLPKGSFLNFIVKIEKTQTLEEAIAEIKTAEVTAANAYITRHNLKLTTTASGLRYVVTQPTAKRKPLKGDTVLVNYIGHGVDEKLFDTSVESVAKAGGLDQPGRKYEPYPVVLGEHHVVAGWEEMLALMNEGSKVTCVIPSALGYGETGNGDIKPFSTMVFDLELVKVKPAKHAVAKPAPRVVKKPLAKKRVAAKKKQ